MVLLTRTVRFAINPPDLRGSAADAPGSNGYAGSPPVRGLGRHYEVQIVCRGEIDPVTGYLINIKDIDAAARRTVVSLIGAACRDRPWMDPAALLPELVPPLRAELGGSSLLGLRWRLSPYYSVEMSVASPEDARHVLLRQKFDFSASHRLHTPALSQEENRRLYGKCNNPGGHGHNYQFEPCVAVEAGREGAMGGPFTLDDLERLGEEVIVRRFDHKNLNVDTREFSAESGGLNPSVENIAKVFYDLLAPAVRERGAELRSLTVWETDRTSATYPASP